MILATVVTTADAAPSLPRTGAYADAPLVVVALADEPALADLAAATAPDHVWAALADAVTAIVRARRPDTDPVVFLRPDLLAAPTAANPTAHATESASDTEPPAPPLLVAPGLPYDRVMVSLHLAARTAGLAAPHPFLDPDAFVAWCAASDLGGHAPVPRYFMELRRLRHDLLVGYPEVPGLDAAEFLEWIRVYGLAETGLPASFSPPAPRPGHDVYDQAGANIVGMFAAELGMAEVARRLADAAHLAHVPTARITFTSDHHRTTREAAQERARFDTNIVCLNADSLPSFTQQVGPSFYEGRTTIGVWFWETAHFPSMFHGAMRTVDEIWAASDFVADVFRAVAPPEVPVVRFPLPIVAPAVAAGVDRATFALPTDHFLFHTSFDYRSVANRKNPFGVVEAYCRAFAPTDGAHLVVKSINEAADPHAAARVHALASGRADITFLDAVLTPAENAALLAHADCHVSLHRSEGFGFNIADALALGVPFIATGATGNLAFCRAEHGVLVPATEVLVGEGSFPYEPGSTWFEPDLAFAAEAMRAMVDDPSTARARAAAGRAWVLAEFHPARTGRFVRDRLAACRAERVVTPPPAPAEPPRDRSVLARVVARARERIHV